MANSRLLPRNGVNTDLVTYTIRVNEEPLPTQLRILGLAIRKEVNRIPAATLVFIDGSPARQDFPVSNQRYFVPGNTIEVWLGHHSDESRVFKGVVVKQRISVREHTAHLEVDCRDAAYQMTLRRKGAYFEQITDSDLAAQLLQSYSLTNTVEDTLYQHPVLVQHDTTDWDFLLMRMDMNGMLTIVSDGEVAIGKPDFSQPPVVQLAYGATVLEFDGELEARDQFAQVTTRAWDYTNQEILETDAAEPNIQANGNLSAAELSGANGDEPAVHRHGGQILEGELQAWADARLLKERLSRSRGRVKIRGFTGVAVGQLVDLFGFGERFDGTVYVAGIRHEFYEGLWTTEVEFGLCPDWFAREQTIPAPSAAGMLGPVGGLQYGVVTQIEEDPAGEHRIKVRLPVIDDQAEGFWARVATLDAGNNRGTFFLPEVNDEVVVGFVNDDPRHAVVLGMLHSQNKAAPFTATEENHEKGYVSRGESKLVFDDEKRSILLMTKEENQLLISDDEEGIILADQHGNSIRMNSSGIFLESAGDLNLEAEQNIANKAGGAWQAQARSQAKLSANGMMEIVGKPVNIN